MPHLAPLKWMLMPSIILLITYIHITYLFYLAPSSFPNLPLSQPIFTSWHW